MMRTQQFVCVAIVLVCAILQRSVVVDEEDDGAMRMTMKKNPTISAGVSAWSIHVVKSHRRTSISSGNHNGLVNTAGRRCCLSRSGHQQQHHHDCLAQGSSRDPTIHAEGLLAAAGSDDEAGDSEEGADLAAEFFKMAQEKGIQLDEDDLAVEAEGYDDEEEDEGDDEGSGEDGEEEVNIPQGAINAFLGYDTGEVGDKLAGNVSLTDDQLYSEVKERVLDTAGGFVDLVGGANDNDDSDDDTDEDGVKKPKPYAPPTTVPDSDLTAGEVVILVLEALLHNDVPSPNRGVEILFGYSSPSSQIKNEDGLTPGEYAEFLKETEYKVLFDHQGATIGKGDYSFDGKKAFFTARLQVGDGALDSVSVNFILSTTGVDDDACWLVDSMLIRPQSMRRRRRR